MAAGWRSSRLAGAAQRLRPLGERVLRATELAYYELFLGPQGRGRPLSSEHWEAQYREGHWRFLGSLDELPRYAVIAGYIQTLHPRPTVLDVGCGHGQLLALLREADLAAYHGIDLSAEALAEARRRASAAAVFEQADFTRWRPAGSFDIIVFNEVLYYASQPVRAVERYRDALAADGMLIVSMFRHRNTRLIWRALGQRFRTYDAAEVKNRKGEVVDIRLLRPR